MNQQHKSKSKSSDCSGQFCNVKSQGAIKFFNQQNDVKWYIGFDVQIGRWGKSTDKTNFALSTSKEKFGFEISKIFMPHASSHMW